VFESRALREIFRIVREEGKGDWRKVRSEELHYCTVQQILVGGGNWGE
jgi:hypothetical protein